MDGGVGAFLFQLYLHCILPNLKHVSNTSGHKALITSSGPDSIKKDSR